MSQGNQPTTPVNSGQRVSSNRRVLSAIGNNQVGQDPYPTYIKKPNEKLESNGNNYIVFGTDRIGRFTTTLPNGIRLENPIDKGHGSLGEDGSYMIDMFVGFQGNTPIDTIGGRQLKSESPNFDLDAARIYISQRVDIDEAFGLCAGLVGNSIAKSGIGIKADAIRIIGREGIKIITGTGKKELNQNSRGAPIGRPRGIDLIAGNNDEGEQTLQPLVKGNNLNNCIRKIYKDLEEYGKVISQVIDIIDEVSREVAAHVHNSPFFGAPTSISLNYNIANPIIKFKTERVKLGIQALVLGHDSSQKDFTTPAGRQYICSSFNNTN